MQDSTPVNQTLHRSLLKQNGIRPNVKTTMQDFLQLRQSNIWPKIAFDQDAVQEVHQLMQLPEHSLVHAGKLTHARHLQHEAKQL
jgi:hypothetical protein